MTVRESQTGPRRYRTISEAEQLAAEFEASGLTRQDFCDRNDVALNTLARYLTRRRQQKTDSSEPRRWVKVEIADRQRAIGSELSVVLADGRRIEVRRGFDIATLQQLVTVLEPL